MVGKESSATPVQMLPAERAAFIAQLNKLTSSLSHSEKPLLEKLIQASINEETLLREVQREDLNVIVALMAGLIASTHAADLVAPVLELLVMLLRLEGANFAAAFALHANSEKTRDPGMQLEKWAWDDNTLVYRAMEAFSIILTAASEDYVAKWLRSLLRLVQSRLKEAKQAAEGAVSAEMILTAEASVKALSILSKPVHLREQLIQQSVQGDLSPPALLPALLFPRETAFATAVQEQPQFVYDAVKAIWQLSFSGTVLDDLDAQCRQTYEASGHSIIGVLNNLLRKQGKDKIIRMVLHVLVNYVARHKEHSPLETLHELLETHVEDLSSYAMYTQEVNSCMLEWSPPHTSEKFWRENIKSFEADGFVAIHELAKIIATSKEPLNVQIACHDIGEFVRAHPQGKRVWEKLNIKHRVYDLIDKGAGTTTEEREGVKRHALLCMQKIMIQRYDLL